MEYTTYLFGAARPGVYGKADSAALNNNSITFRGEFGNKKNKFSEKNFIVIYLSE